MKITVQVTESALAAHPYDAKVEYVSVDEARAALRYFERFGYLPHRGD